MDVLRPRSPEAWRPGFAMAMLAHGILLLLLLTGLQWQTKTPDALQAEVWAEIPQPSKADIADPPAKLESPEPPLDTQLESPPAAVAPTPPPDTPVAPVKPAATPVLKTPAPRKAAKEVFMPDSPAVQAKLSQARRTLEKPAAAVEPEKPQLPMTRPSEAEKSEPKPAARMEPPKPVPPPEPVKPQPITPPVETKPATVAVTSVPSGKTASAPASSSSTPKLNELLSREELEKARRDNLKRMMAKLNEDALHSAGPSPEYAARIRARIQPHIVFADTLPNNPLAVVEVNCSPDGRIIGRKIIIPSGVAAWDTAVLRALDKTAVLPKNEQGKVPSPMRLEFKPKDF